MVSLIIPTFNRPDHLKRILQFYTTLSVKFPIYIADSSEESYKRDNEKIIFEINNPLIKLYNSFSSSIFFSTKIHKVLCDLTTPYSVLVADDDFILPSSIMNCVYYLENNPDYSLAQGNHYGFMNSNLDVQFFMMNHIYGIRSIENFDGLERISNIILRYIPALYGVSRTSLLKKITESCSIYAKDGIFNESLHRFLMALHGKIKYLSIPYIFRELSFSSWGITGEKKWLDSVGFQDNLNFFIEGISSNLFHYGNIDKKNASLLGFAYGQELIKYFKKMTIPERSILKRMCKKIVPNLIQKKLRFLKQKFKLFLLKNKIAQESFSLNDKNSLYFDDVLNVKKAIISSPIFSFLEHDGIPLKYEY